MERRNFLKLCGLAGFSVALPTLHASATNPQDPLAYDGPLYVMLNALGGWDPTLLCDPKGSANPDDPDAINKSYTPGQIQESGKIKYAPVEGHQAFFDKHYQDLMVVNGIDFQTNSHDAGQRHFFSGSLNDRTPSFAALVAAHHGAELPMSFMTFGGYAETGGFVAQARVGSVGALSRLAYPGRIDPDEETRRFHSENAASLLESARRDREDALLSRAQLYRPENAMNLLFAARSGSSELQKLQQFLPDPLDDSGNQLRRQAQLIIAAYRAGITTAANMALGGFDTHGNNDDGQTTRLQQLLDGLDFLLEEAERQGVRDNIVVIAGSDFGRTPIYNDGNGKDHWSVGSMMAIGKGIKGNRVIGATTDGQTPRSVNPNSLELSDGGVRITPAHIHQQLRKKASVETSEAAELFPVEPAESMSKIFTG